jgi:hypothetical protein
MRRPYLVWPRANLYIVAAFETMKSRGWLPRLMAAAGASPAEQLADGDGISARSRLASDGRPAVWYVFGR